MKAKAIITLFVVDGMPENTTAFSALEGIEKKLPRGTKFEVVVCPKSMLDRYHFPFLKDADDRGYYGLRGVDLFLRRLDASRQPQQEHAAVA